MSTSRHSPKYLRQKHKNRPDQAYVKLGGRRRYLGEYDSPESRQKFRRVVAEWEANGACPDLDDVGGLTIVELSAAFWQHAQGYYVTPGGEPSSEQGHFKRVLSLLVEYYGYVEVQKFGPKALKALREKIIDRGICRPSVNKTVERIRKVFKWGVEEELVPARVFQALQAVAGLKKFRTIAKEPEPVKPVALEDVYTIEPYVSRQVWAAIQV